MPKPTRYLLSLLLITGCIAANAAADAAARQDLALQPLTPVDAAALAGEWRLLANGRRMAAVAPAFATHSFGMNQRVVALAVASVAQLDVGVYEAEVATPPSPGVAPPGYYLWFVVHAGVPSSAAWVRLRPLGAAP